MAFLRRGAVRPARRRRRPRGRRAARGRGRRPTRSTPELAGGPGRRRPRRRSARRSRVHRVHVHREPASRALVARRADGHHGLPPGGAQTMKKLRITVERQGLRRRRSRCSRTTSRSVTGAGFLSPLPPRAAGAASRRPGAGAAPRRRPPAGAPIKGDPNAILAPIAGTVQKVFVQAGSQVEAKTPVVLLDAMKMDTYIYAPAHRRGRGGRASSAGRRRAGRRLPDPLHAGGLTWRSCSQSTGLRAHHLARAGDDRRRLPAALARHRARSSSRCCWCRSASAR